MLYVNENNTVLFRTKPDTTESVYYYNLATMAMPTISLKAVVLFMANQLRLIEVIENEPHQFDLYLDYLANIETPYLKGEADRFELYFKGLSLQTIRQGQNVIVEGLNVASLIDLIHDQGFQELNNLKSPASVWKVLLK